MTPESVTIRQPEHPVSALTTYELAGYRRELEKTLAALPGRAPAASRPGGCSPRSWPNRQIGGNRPPAGDPVTSLPRPGEAMRLTAVLQEHPRWSAFWDKRYRVWRVSENDPDSDLYAERETWIR